MPEQTAIKLTPKRFSVTALKDYRNGAIAWAQGVSGNWPKGETRVLVASTWEQVLRDGQGLWSVNPYAPPEILAKIDALWDKATALDYAEQPA